MSKCFIGILLLAVTQTALSETITVTDGRTIELNEDGTYQVITTSGLSNSHIEVDSHKFERHTDEYSQNSIRFMPIFLNTSEKTIVAVKFESTFLDPFGDAIYSANGTSEGKIKPTKKSLAKLFYVFEDNQFMGGQPYDKLLSSVINNTGSIKTTVTTIVFEGGEVVKF